MFVLRIAVVFVNKIVSPVEACVKVKMCGYCLVYAVQFPPAPALAIRRTEVVALLELLVLLVAVRPRLRKCLYSAICRVQYIVSGR